MRRGKWRRDELVAGAPGGGSRGAEGQGASCAGRLVRRRAER